MSKKTKKTGNQEVQQQVEGQGVINGEENVPATIVDSSEEQLFAGQQGTQEVVTEKSGEKPASKLSKRPYIEFVAECLEKGIYDRKELIAAVLEKFPTVSKGGIQTFVTDLRNPKYSHFRDRKVVLYGNQGKLIFEDRISAKAEIQPEAISEDVPSNEPTEKPAE